MSQLTISAPRSILHSVRRAAIEPASPIDPAPDAPTLVRSTQRGHNRLGLGKADPRGWLIGPALLLIYWAAGSATDFIDPRILPAPWTTVHTAIGLIADGRLPANLLVSLVRVVEGVAIGTVVGVVLALIAGLSLVGGYIFDSLMQLKRAIPVLAVIPFFILWFGIGEVMKESIIVLAVVTPVYLQTHNALRGIDLRYVELAETTRLSQWQFLRHIVLPGALPGFLLGFRFAVLWAWLALVVVEQFNATSGIGYMINLAEIYAQTDVMLVGVVTYAVMGAGSEALVRVLEGRLLGWRRTLAA